MKKPIMLAFALLFFVGNSFAYERTWTLSCGKKAVIVSASNDIDDIKDAVSSVNLSLCGTKPTTFIFANP